MHDLTSGVFTALSRASLSNTMNVVPNCSYLVTVVAFILEEPANFTFWLTRLSFLIKETGLSHLAYHKPFPLHSRPWISGYPQEPHSPGDVDRWADLRAPNSEPLTLSLFYLFHVLNGLEILRPFPGNFHDLESTGICCS